MLEKKDGNMDEVIEAQIYIELSPLYGKEHVSRIIKDLRRIEKNVRTKRDTPSRSV